MTSRPSGFQLTSAGKLRLYSTAELEQLPEPEWLIDGIMPRGGVVGLYGPPGEGKSFVAIDMACAIATGEPWQGFATYKGFVIYIAAEGGVGITKRVKAWRFKYGKAATDVQIGWLVEAVAVNNDADDVDNIIARIDNEVQEEPVLIIIDTLARCFDGNENEQEDMGRFIAGVDRMRLQYNATVIIVHHTNASGSRERGNTAFRGAADTMIAVCKDKDVGTIRVECNKQKDSTDFDPINLQFEIVPEFDSAVVVKAEVAKADQLLQWLAVGPLAFSELKARQEEPESGMSFATLKRLLKQLIADGKIRKDDSRVYHLVESEDDDE